MSGDIIQRRAEIEGVVAGRTLCDELRQVAETAGDAWAYADEATAGADDGAGDGWRSLAWSQVRERVLELAAGFAALGLPVAGARQGSSEYFRLVGCKTFDQMAGELEA